MDVYTFALKHLRVIETRSPGTDTLKLSHSAYVDGDIVAYDFGTLGDFFGGIDSDVHDYDTGKRAGLFEVVINDPSAKVAFIFQLVNAGNVPDGALAGRLTATSDQLASVAFGLAGAGADSVTAAVDSGSFYAGILIEAFANIWAWLSTDCDGPVAVDQISGPRYVIDAWADDRRNRIIEFQQLYPGSDSPDGCGPNSLYYITWSLQHYRRWMVITDPVTGEFRSDIGVSATVHNGALHAFGALARTGVTHARTFTGLAWSVDGLGLLQPVDLSLPVSAVSFNDRLFVFGVLDDGSVSSLAFTVDGGSWVPHFSGPIGLHTGEPIASVVFRNRLYLLARDLTTGFLNVTSSTDLESWEPWAQLPKSALSPAYRVAAAVLRDTLFVFGIHQIGTDQNSAVVVRTSTLDGITWTGWEQVEAGAFFPEHEIGTTQPLYISATVFRDRVYIATPWKFTDMTGEIRYYVAVNFSGDGENWSGWRQPESILAFESGASVGLAAVGNHLYIVSRQWDRSEFPDDTLVQVY
jgi:hypothetical protein